MRQVRTYQCRQSFAPTTRPTLDDGWAWVTVGPATDRIWYGRADTWRADAVRTPRTGPDEYVEWKEPTVYEGSRKMTSEETIREDIQKLRGWSQPGLRGQDLIGRLVCWLAERELARPPAIPCPDIPPSGVNPQAMSAWMQTMRVGGPTGDIRANHGLE